MTPWVKIRATGTENIPEKGPYLLVFNHLSDVDPLCVCWYFMKRGVPVRFLAKKSMFGVPVFGKIIHGMGLIPVDREKNPSQALLPATRALNSGEVVCIWPEGTHTQEPDMWPMSFKTVIPTPFLSRCINKSFSSITDLIVPQSPTFKCESVKFDNFTSIL